MDIRTITAQIDQYKTGSLTTTSKTGKNAAKKDVQESSTDTISLSSRAKLLQNAGEAANGSTGVRAEKVAVLKEQIESGEYTPDFQTIAQNMLTDDRDILG
jgi:flagellar biosynthesis anti-sigma factor FlgM